MNHALSNPRPRRSARITLASAALLIICLVVFGQGALASLAYLLLSSLPIIAALWLAAAGYGWAITRALRLPHRIDWTTQAGLGMAAMMLVQYAVGCTIGLNTWEARLIVGIGLALLLPAWRHSRAATRPRHARVSSTNHWPILCAMPPLALLMVAACCPPGALWRVEAFGYDVLTYHLQLPREWLAIGRITGHEHNVYSYLPGLMESTYAMLAALRGSVLDAVYLCQLFHASFAVYAALAIASIVRVTTRQHPAGLLAGAMMLAVPWVTITGSLAYNEMAAIAFAAAALRVVYSTGSRHIGGAIAVGLLLGAATLCKLTAGPMLAAPIGLLLLWRRCGGPMRYRGLALFGITVLAGLLTLTPYFIRNAAWTGNPVFPFATDVFGSGHWQADQTHAWRQAHGLAAHASHAVTELSRRWFFNAGYGAIGGREITTDVTDIARFKHEGGVPILWLAVIAAGVIALLRRRTRGLSLAMLLFITVQLAFWVFATHRQSRFLTPILLPACVLLGFGVAGGYSRRQLRWVSCALATALPLALTALGYTILHQQTRPIAINNRWQPAPIWLLIDSLDQPGRPGLIGQHPINELPPQRHKTLLIADNGSLLYLRGDITYATPFDRSPLGDVIRAVGDDPAAINAALRQQGFTHAWVGWSEFDRLEQTYGNDPAVTRDLLQRLVATWQPQSDPQAPATLYLLLR